MSEEMKRPFIKIPRQFFQTIKVAPITDYVKCLSETDSKFKGVDPAKLFTTYALLIRDRNHFGECPTNLRAIYDYLYNTYDTKSMGYLKSTMEMLRFLELIDYDFDMKFVKGLDSIRISVFDTYKESGQYLELHQEDYAILEIAGYRAFTVYCAINNYYLVKDGHTNISMDKIADVCRMGKSAVKAEVDTLLELGVYEKEHVGMVEYQYNPGMNKAIKACNRYIPKPERVVELWQAYKRDLKQKYKTKESEEKKR